jgi:hypothetical protein
MKVTSLGEKPEAINHTVKALNSLPTIAMQCKPLIIAFQDTFLKGILLKIETATSKHPHFAYIHVF